VKKSKKSEKISAISARERPSISSISDNVLSDKIKKHLEDLEQPKNQSSMQIQPANMLINKRVLPSRLVKSRNSFEIVRSASTI